MPRGNFIPLHLRSHYAKQAGIRSGQVRRNKIFGKYMAMIPDRGIAYVLQVALREQWLRGYNARQKFEARRLDKDETNSY